MVVYLYRWKLKAGREPEFKASWALVTQALRQNCGSKGSRLHLSSNGDWLGYAQWPSPEARDSCQFSSPEFSRARASMKEAIEISYPEERLAVEEDFLVF
ncbi:MAG: hypothetical protein EOP11_01905 [Proteobacteria bacterium]|nr:MAG: hypothetical protein EOP11_01905 [Pseudomonadota bacterium]